MGSHISMFPDGHSRGVASENPFGREKLSSPLGLGPGADQACSSQLAGYLVSDQLQPLRGGTRRLTSLRNKKAIGFDSCAYSIPKDSILAIIVGCCSTWHLTSMFHYKVSSGKGLLIALPQSFAAVVTLSHLCL